MKKTLLSSLLPAIFITILSSCAGPPPGLERFIGNWQGISKDNKDTIVIKKVDDHLFIFKGKDQKDTLSAIYDQQNKYLKIYCISTSVINYIEKNGHLSVNHGADGEYQRLTH